MGIEPMSRSLTHQAGPVLVKDLAGDIRCTKHGEGLAERLASLRIASGVNVGELSGHVDLNGPDLRRLHAAPCGSSPGGHPRIRAAKACTFRSYGVETWLPVAGGSRSKLSRQPGLGFVERLPVAGNRLPQGGYRLPEGGNRLPVVDGCRP